MLKSAAETLGNATKDAEQAVGNPVKVQGTTSRLKAIPAWINCGAAKLLTHISGMTDSIITPATIDSSEIYPGR